LVAITFFAMVLLQKMKPRDRKRYINDLFTLPARSSQNPRIGPGQP